MPMIKWIGNRAQIKTSQWIHHGVDWFWAEKTPKSGMRQHCGGIALGSEFQQGWHIR
jgi:hypothetical protein